MARMAHKKRTAMAQSLQLEFGQLDRIFYELDWTDDQLLLEAMLRAGTNISGIATDREISNVIAFGHHKVPGATMNAEVTATRQEADRLVSARILTLFCNSRNLHVGKTGHFWYPPGGYMGWHTNLR